MRHRAVEVEQDTMWSMRDSNGPDFTAAWIGIVIIALFAWGWVASNPELATRAWSSIKAFLW